MSEAGQEATQPERGVLLEFSMENGVARSNFAEWQEITYALAKCKFGELADVITTGTLTVDAPPVKSTFETLYGPGIAADTAYLEMVKEFTKESKAQTKKNTLLCGFIETLLSGGSRDQMKGHADYVRENRDPAKLMKILKESHSEGVSAGMTQTEKDRALLAAEAELAGVKMGPLPMMMVTHKETFVRAQLKVASCGGDNGSATVQALRFMDSLDAGRYGEYMLNVTNGTKTAPSSIAECQKAAEKYVNRVSTSSVMVAEESSSRMDSIEATMVEIKELVLTMNASAAAATKPSGAAQKKYKDPRAKGLRCHWCQLMNHFQKDCSARLAGKARVPPVAEETVGIGFCDPADDLEELEDADTWVATVGPDADLSVAPVRMRDYTVSTVTDHVVDVLHSVHNGPYSPTEIIFDPGAQRSVVMNPRLLKSIERIPPVLLKGIAGDNKLLIDQGGQFAGLRKPHQTSYNPHANANVFSQAVLVDEGHRVQYLEAPLDQYVLDEKHVFARKQAPGHGGRLQNHYVHDFAKELRPAEDVEVHVQTVSGNLADCSRREVQQVQAANEMLRRLGHAPPSAGIAVINSGANTDGVSATHVRMAEKVTGRSAAQLKGSSTRKSRKVKPIPLAARVTQVEQTLCVDFMFVKSMPFLMGVLTPLHLVFCVYLKERTATAVAAAIKLFRALAKGRNFDVAGVRSDGEGGVEAMRQELSELGSPLEEAGPDDHVGVIERVNRLVKERQRSVEHGLPYAMSRLLLIFSVLYCVLMINWQPRAGSGMSISPNEQYLGIKMDVKRDLRVGFGDYVEALVPNGDNSTKARTQGCIALLPTGNATGTVKFMSLATGRVVSRTQWTALPMPDIVIAHMNKLGHADGYTKGGMAASQKTESSEPLNVPEPSSMSIYGRQQAAQPSSLQPLASAAGVDLLEDGHGETVPTPVEQVQQLRRGRSIASRDFGPAGTTPLQPQFSSHAPAPAPGVPEGPPTSPAPDPGVHEPTAGVQDPAPTAAPPQPSPTKSLPALRTRSQRSNFGVPAPRFDDMGFLTLLRVKDDVACLHRQLQHREKWHDAEFALTMSVKAALAERGDEARPVIMAELRRMLSKKVWHPVHTRGMSHVQKKGILRSSMFIKDKYHASGAFDRFKARLVAGGNRQDKELYDDLSSPTAATASVLVVAAIAASEGRIVETFDVGGAFLNANIKLTGILVFVRLDRIMTGFLLQLAPEYKEFVQPDGTLVVELDKALYGCVEAAKLWYDDLTEKLEQHGYVRNKYDPCVMNKTSASGVQTTIVMHVDDLFVTSASQEALDELDLFLKSKYEETARHTGKMHDYVGMTFDFATDGEVSVTMTGAVNDILANCEGIKERCTPAASTLFDVRDAKKLGVEDARALHSKVAQVLYVAKRVRPECLTAVAFLTTRVQSPDIDDQAKLNRLLGYLKGSRDRGITLRIGAHIGVKAYIDAAYGVHAESGKSHTGCVVMVGTGPVFVKSAKQKIVTKSSTEAELVALSDTAAQAIHLRNFILEQGYETGPAVLYQDNLSCMALMKRGGPCSEKSRHINIRHFWLADRVTAKEVVLEHKGTVDMVANALTKPVQGQQFVHERAGLTNWKEQALE